MYKARFILLSFLVFLLALGGCQGEGTLTGEVFVVTKGGSNVELGDLEVKAIPSSEWEQHLKQKYRRAEEIVAKKVSKTEPLIDSIEDVRAELKKRRQKVEEARSRLGDASSALGELSSEIGSNPPSPDEVGELYATSQATLQQAPLGATITEIEAGTVLSPIELEENFYVVSYSGEKGYVYAKYLVTEERYKSYQQRRQRQNQRQRALSEKLEEAGSRYDEVLQRCSALRDSLVSTGKVGDESVPLPKFLTETARFRNYEFYLRDTPKPNDTDRTGSEGKFKLTLTQGKPHYLVAHRTRSVGGSEEDYYWMEKTMLKGESGEAVLSNSNMDSELPDSLDAVANSSINTSRLFDAIERCE